MRARLLYSDPIDQGNPQTNRVEPGDPVEPGEPVIIDRIESIPPETIVSLGSMLGRLREIEREHGITAEVCGRSLRWERVAAGHRVDEARHRLLIGQLTAFKADLLRAADRHGFTLWPDGFPPVFMAVYEQWARERIAAGMGADQARRQAADQVIQDFDRWMKGEALKA